MDTNNLKSLTDGLSQQLLKEMTDAMPDRHFLIDETGKIYHCFGNVSHELFYQMEGLDKYSVSDIPINGDKTLVMDKINECLVTHKIVSFEYSLSLAELNKVFPSITGPKTEQWYELKIYPTNFTQDNKKIIILSSRHITERKKQEIALKKLTITDPLTGLYNRRYAATELTNCLHLFKRYKTDVSLLLIDIDHFKRINDQYGHDIGDNALVKLSTFFKKEMRKGDFVCRMGGEEFMIVMSNTSTSQALKFAARLLSNVRKLTIETSKGSLYLTLSGGISQLQIDDKSIDVAIKRADDAMYLSKSNGRNRVTIM